jgi:hypothetical protein
MWHPKRRDFTLVGEWASWFTGDESIRRFIAPLALLVTPVAMLPALASTGDERAVARRPWTGRT